MQPGDVDSINGILGLLKTGGNAVLVFAGYMVWKFNERLTRLEAAEEARNKPKKDKDG